MVKLSAVYKAILEETFRAKFRKLIDKKVKRYFAFIEMKIGNAIRPMWASKVKVNPKKIVFMSYSNSYMCNPKYLCEEFLKREENYDLVFIADTKNEMIVSEFPNGVRLVKRGSYESLYELASAKVWIDNSLNCVWKYLGKKDEQIYIETWHGSLGLKRAGKGDVKNKRWVKAAKKVSKLTDYCISNSTFEDSVYRDTHWQKQEIFRYGHARNDIFFDDEMIANSKKKVYEFFKDQLSTEDKICLYAPTFRDSGNLDPYDIDFSRLIEALTSRFGGNWKILMRFHFHDRNNTTDNLGQAASYLIDATKYTDMMELLCVTDVGISDYSSWLCDYVLSKKPAFIYANDLEEYNTERGLYYPLETTPFPIATNNDELVSNIMSFNNDKYVARCGEFITDKGCVDDGLASKRTVDKIIELMNSD